MAKTIPDAILDAQLEACEGDRVVVCAGQPVDYNDAVVTKKLAITTIVPATEFTKANGDTSGRKNTLAQQDTVTIDSSGDGDHVAIADSGTTELRRVTTCTSQALTAGGTVDIGAHKHEIADPT